MLQFLSQLIIRLFKNDLSNQSRFILIEVFNLQYFFSIIVDDVAYVDDLLKKY